MFVQEVRKYAKEENALKKAIDACIYKGILSDYLRRKGSEVRNMLIAEYSYEKDIQIKQQEARAEGKREGIREGKREGKREGRAEGMLLSARIFQLIKSAPSLTDSQAAEKLGCTPEEVENARKMFEI